jgi:hypothetical protein
MSFRTGSRPKWLYWTENGWHYILRLRLYIAFAGKSKRRSNDFAGSTSRQWSPDDDLALARFAGFAYAKRAALALAEFATFALRWFIALGPPSVARRAASTLHRDRGRVSSPPLP